MKNHESEPTLVQTENKPDPVGPRHLTESQSKAFHDLEALCQLAGHGEAYGGFVPRAKPLLLGPSGAGKSALVGRLAETTGLPLLRVNAGSWIVYSARSTPYTLDVIRRFVCTHQRGIILLDEIDKCVPSGEKAVHSDWDLSIFTELLSLYDACPRLLTSGWRKPDVDRLKGHFLIGAGAWQKQIAKAEVNHSSHAEEVSKDFGIPAELAYRFNARPIVIELPNRTDFTKAIQRVHTDLGLDKIPPSKIDDLVTRAIDARCGLRWLEQYVSDCLSAHPHLRRQSPPSTTEPTKQSKTPTSLAEYKAHQEHFFELLREAEHVIPMTRIEVKRWNGQFDRPSVLTTIRRKIQGAQMSGTVLIDLEGTVMTHEQVAEITRGWLDYKVKCCGSVDSLPHPLPENASVKASTKRSLAGGDSATNREQTDSTQGHEPRK